MPGQGFQVGPFPVDEVEYQQPTAHQVMPMPNARSHPPQTLGDAARQTGQGHDPGLLGDTRADGHSRASILGSAWTVKGFHA
jgi:hypothetical protein